jgi:hypothetical protein
MLYSSDFSDPMERCSDRDFKFLALGEVESLEKGMIPTAVATI